MKTLEYVYKWEFKVHPGKQHEFEKLYGPEGDWEKLFKKHPGYISTQLLKSTEQENTFITIDYWKSKEDLDEFKSTFKNEFEILEKEGEKLTISEKQVGNYFNLR